MSIAIKNCMVAPLAAILTIYVMDRFDKEREMRLHFNRLTDGIIIGIVSISGASDQYANQLQ